VVWSAGYGLLGAFWWSGGAGFPYGTANDAAARLSLLGGVTQTAGAPAIAALGVVGAGVAVAMAVGWGGGWQRVGLTAFGLGAAFVLALLIPDYRVFVFVAYTPIALLGAPFGLDPGVLLDVFSAPMINQIACMGGGVVWAAASVVYWQRTGAADDAPRRTSVASARTWGRWATFAAVAVPLVYALTRYAWALGMPFGISEELFRRGQESGLWLVGAALATLAAGGAVLTMGLIRRWGEVFPRWIPKLGGRQVPVALVIVPATTVALLVTNAGLMFWRLTFSGGFLLGDIRLTLEDDWAALAPELLWPVWGVALGGATFAYYLRRRSQRQTTARTPSTRPMRSPAGSE
jgi:hypothetical protein